MSATLVFQTTGLDSRITHFNIYRNRSSAGFVRIAQISIQAQYTDATGQVGDQYYYTFWDSTRMVESGPSPVITVADSLDAVTISGYCLNLDGTQAAEDIVITVKLQNTKLSAPTSDGQLIATTVQETTTDSSGAFVFTAVPNDLIFPADTYYEISYLEKRYFKVIKSTNGSGQLFVNLQDVSPRQLR